MFIPDTLELSDDTLVLSDDTLESSEVILGLSLLSNAVTDATALLISVEIPSKC